MSKPSREAPRCPWCGTEMGMAGIIHESKYYYFCVKCGCDSPTMETKEIAYAAAMKRAELDASYRQVSKALCGKEDATVEEVLAVAQQVKQPMQKPLTLEEAQNQTTDIEDCFPVWVETNRQDVLAVALDRWDSNWKVYGKHWRCRLRKPTDEERANAAWEE